MDLRATTIWLQFYKHARTAFQRPADRRSIRVEVGPDLAITRSCRAHETAYKLGSRKFASRILHSPARIGVEDGRNYALPPRARTRTLGRRETWKDTPRRRVVTNRPRPSRVEVRCGDKGKNAQTSRR